MTIAIYLDNFRNHASKFFEIHPGLNIIYGNNGTGKTSMLEAISLLTPGSGLRKAKSLEMAHNGSDFWNISIKLQANDVTISYQNGSKNILWNGSKISLQELVDEVGISWLTPQIMFGFWKDTKSRRHFIDRVTSNYVPSYSYHYMYYEKMRTSRNKLLHERSCDKNAYAAIESLMVTHGLELMKNRMMVVEKLNSLAHCELTLQDSLDIKSDSIKQVWINKLAQSRHLETTNLGPHKTDIKIQCDGKDGLKASTGEQNSMIISLLLAAFNILQQSTKILLLDDVFSHLDEPNRKKFLEYVTEKSSDCYICITDVTHLGVSGNLLGL